MSIGFNKKTEIVILTILLLIYIFLAQKEILHPAINDDEVLSACGTIDLLNGRGSHYLSTFSVLGRHLPLFNNTYHMAAISYFQLPFFLLLGVSTYSLRMASIFFGLLTIVFTYLFCRKAFNRGVALVASLLLVTSPYFISATRGGEFYHSYVTFFTISSLYCLFRWYRDGRLRYFILGTFLLGLGCSTAGWFIAYPVALLFLVFVFWKEIRERIKKGKIKTFYLILSGMVSFCFGDFLFIYANFINGPTRFITLKMISQVFPVSLYGARRVNNFDFTTNLVVRFNNLIQLLGENDIIRFTTFSPTIGEGNNFYPLLFALVVLWLIFLFVFKRISVSKRKMVVSFFILVGTILLISPFTAGICMSWHLLATVPLIQIIVALGLTEFILFFKNEILRKISLGIVCTCLLIITTLNLGIFGSYYREAGKRKLYFSSLSAIYDVADWLKRINYSSALAFGHARSLYFLTSGKKRVYDFDILDREEELSKLLNDQDTLYVFDVLRSHSDESLISFTKIINSMGKDFVDKKTFYSMDNIPIFEVYSVTDKRQIKKNY